MLKDFFLNEVKNGIISSIGESLNHFMTSMPTMVMNFMGSFFSSMVTICFGLVIGIYMLIDFSGLAHIFGTPTLLGTWWYLGLAFMEIMLLPFLYYVYRKCGAFTTIALSYLLPMALSLPMSSSVVHYLPAMTLGIWFAQEDLFPKAVDTYRAYDHKGSRVLCTCCVHSWNRMA